MNGKIGFESELGKGSTFWAIIQLVVKEEHPKDENKLLISNSNAIIIYPLERRLEIIEKYLKFLNFQNIKKSLNWIDIDNPENYILFISSEFVDSKDLSHFKDVILIQKYDHIGQHNYKTLKIHFNFQNIKSLLLNQPIVKVKKKEKLLNNKRILICEDNLVIHRLEKKLLTENGGIIESAYDGKEAIEKFTNMPKFDLILLDINLPFINGLQICKMIRSFGDKADEVKKTTRIIVLSGSINVQMKKELELDYLVEDVITKPVDIDSLIQKIIHSP